MSASLEDIARIRDATDLAALVGESTPLTRRGRRFVGACRLCSSVVADALNVNPDSGVWHCFACKKAGDCYTWLQKTQSISFHKAVRLLAIRAGVPT